MNRFSESAPRRLLGIDLGSRRVGIAVSDPTGTIATAKETLEGLDDRALIRRLDELAREVGARGFVLGLPRRTDGSDGPEAARVRAFAEQLQSASGLPVHLWDERLTSRQAERALLQAGVRGRERRRVTDRVAAQILLQNFLDAQAGAREP